MSKNNKKIKAHIYFNDSSQIDEYRRIYSGLSFENEYPANKKRMEIILNILHDIRPKNIVDAGCGNGLPLVEILKHNFDCIGYDKSQNMVSEAKRNLLKFGFDAETVCIGDFENPVHLTKNQFDCITGMGAFYYAKDILQTLKRQVDLLKDKGHLVFTLRNRLFDLVTLNQYTRFCL